MGADAGPADHGAMWFGRADELCASLASSQQHQRCALAFTLEEVAQLGAERGLHGLIGVADVVLAFAGGFDCLRSEDPVALSSVPGCLEDVVDQEPFGTTAMERAVLWVLASLFEQPVLRHGLHPSLQGGSCLVRGRERASAALRAARRVELIRGQSD